MQTKLVYYNLQV